MRTIPKSIFLTARILCLTLSLTVVAVCGFVLLFIVDMSDGAGRVGVLAVFSIPIAAALGFVALVSVPRPLTPKSRNLAALVERSATVVFLMYGLLAVVFARGPVRGLLPLLMAGVVVSYWFGKSNLAAASANTASHGTKSLGAKDASDAQSIDLNDK
ncbi:MAG: hypothetical protein JWL81_289 [Verrucomicrobiales bacterium]|nr:hypothetical protein [Verrucomicrobiales bacterium]